MDFESEWIKKLVCLAECHIDIITWKEWWEANSAEVKKRIGFGDFVRLDCVPSLYGPDTFMVKCQKGAQRYLTKQGIPFVHSDTYKRGADEEYRLYYERLEQKRMAEQREIQRKEEQKQRDIAELSDYRIENVLLRQSGIR